MESSSGYQMQTQHRALQVAGMQEFATAQQAAQGAQMSFPHLLEQFYVR